MTELLEIDKKIVLKYLIDDNFTPENNGIKDFTKYQDSFKQRYNYSLENIKKILESNDIKEVNEQDVSKLLNLTTISKAFNVETATQGIVIALKQILDDLYYDSKYFLDRCTRNFTNADVVRQINLFLFYTKMVKDDLGFITFHNGKINSVPITQTISKSWDCWDDCYYDNPMIVDSWDIKEMNSIDNGLKLSINLLSALLSIYPSNEEFNFFYTILETTLNIIIDTDLIFKDIVILANSLDLIRVTPKLPQPVVNPTIFYDQQTVQKKYEVKIAKNFEGLVTGIVLEPEKVDLQGQIVSEEEIYKAMKEYMLNYSNFDVMHNMEVLKSDKGEGRQVALIQNFIAPQDLNYGETVVKKGTWLQETLILDETLKKSVEDGKINGYSIYGKAIITNI